MWLHGNIVMPLNNGDKMIYVSWVCFTASCAFKLFNCTVFNFKRIKRVPIGIDNIWVLRVQTSDIFYNKNVRQLDIRDGAVNNCESSQKILPWPCHQRRFFVCGLVNSNMLPHCIQPFWKLTLFVFHLQSNKQSLASSIVEDRYFEEKLVF
jgi:hypothetical protein